MVPPPPARSPARPRLRALALVLATTAAVGATLPGTATAAGGATDTTTQHTVNGTTFRTPSAVGTSYAPSTATGPGAVSTPPVVRMRAWAIADMDTGRLLGVHSPRRWLPQASTLKLLTAVTAARRVPAVPTHRVTWTEAHQVCACAGLVVGKRYTRGALYNGMLLPSGNDAAEALAGSDPKGRRAFIAAMNATAQRLGATDTRAMNASGLTATGSHSSARDLLVLLRAAQANTTVEPFLRKTKALVGPQVGPSHWVYRRATYLLHYATAQGKSGFTTPAQNTLVVATPMTTSTDHVRRIGVATLGAPDDYSAGGTRALTEWAATNFDHLRSVGRLPAAPGPVTGAQAGLAN